MKDVSILKALRMLGPERISFGSDTPFALMHASVMMYRAIMDGEGMGRDEQELVMGGNLKRILGCS